MQYWRYIKVGLVLNVAMFFSSLQLHGQILIDDVQVVTEPMAYVFVGADIEYKGNKQVMHNGTLDIAGNWYNSSITDSSVFEDKSNGEVAMVGAGQGFYGYLNTRFPNLTLKGTDIKRLYSNISVKTSLNLTDRELDVNGNELYIISADRDAVTFIPAKGYVNTTTVNNGWMCRNMISGANYNFPFGALDDRSSIKYKPLSLNATYSGNIYAQFKNSNPSDEGMSSSNLDKDVSNINAAYYHLLRSDNKGNSVRIDAYPFHAERDGDYNAVAYWNGMDRHWVSTPGSSRQITGVATNTHELSGGILQLSSDIVLPISLANVDYKPADSVIVTPNVMTPNGDGINDYLVFSMLKEYEENELVIFNRWNSNVYQTHNYSNNWNAGDLPEGTYFYILKLKDKVGNWHLVKNYLMIKR